MGCNKVCVGGGGGEGVVGCIKPCGVVVACGVPCIIGMDCPEVCSGVLGSNTACGKEGDKVCAWGGRGVGGNVVGIGIGIGIGGKEACGMTMVWDSAGWS